MNKLTPGKAKSAKTVPGKEIAATQAIATAPGSTESSLTYIPGVKVNSPDNKLYLGGQVKPVISGLTAVSPDPYSIADTIRYTDFPGKLGSEAFPLGGSLYRGNLYRNLTHYIYEVADHFYYLDTALYSGAAFNPANYTAALDLKVAEFATSDNEKVSPFIRGLAQMVRAMKDGIVAQQNTTNPFYSFRESEMFDRLMDYLVTTSRAVVSIQNTRLVLGLQNTAISGMSRWYKDVGRTLFTANNITDINLALVEALDGIRGAFFMPTQLNDYMQHAIIGLIPNQNGSARLFVPRLIDGKVFLSQGFSIANSHVPGSTLAAATTAAAMTSRISTLISYLRAIAEYYQGASANIVKSALTAFAQLPQLGELTAPTLQARQAQIAAINITARSLSGAVQHVCPLNGVVRMGMQYNKWATSGHTLNLVGIPSSPVAGNEPNDQSDIEAGVYGRAVENARVKYWGYGDLSYHWGYALNGFSSTSDPVVAATPNFFGRYAPSLAIGSPAATDSIALAGNAGLLADPSRADRFIGPFDIINTGSSGTLGTETAKSATAGVIPNVSLTTSIQVSGSTYYSGLGAVPELTAPGMDFTNVANTYSATRGSVVVGDPAIDATLSIGSIRDPWTHPTSTRISTLAQPFAGLASCVFPVNGVNAVNSILIANQSDTVVEYTLQDNLIAGFTNPFSAGGLGFLQPSNLKKVFANNELIDRTASEMYAFFGFVPINMHSLISYGWTDNGWLQGGYTGGATTFNVPTQTLAARFTLDASDLGARARDIDLGKMAYIKFVGQPDKYHL